MNDQPQHPMPWLLQLPASGSVEGAEKLEGGPDAPEAGGGEQPTPNVSPSQSPERLRLPPDTLGLALSGGGIRSASFCLGVVQSLTRAGWLRRVDYLSTVSGGGYIGAFLGRYFDVHRHSRVGGVPKSSHTRIASELNDPDSPSLRWLRQHANYIAPTGIGEVLFGVAAFWRNFLAVQLVLAISFFAVFGIINAVGYWPRKQGLMELAAWLAPLTAILPEAWSTPWATVTEVLFWLTVVALMLAYWLVSQDEHESFLPPVLAAAALAAVALTLGTFHPLGLAILAAAVFWTLEAWVSVRRREGSGSPTSRFRLALSRNHLTHRLAFWLAVTVGFAGLGIVDALGQWLARWMFEGGWTWANVMRWGGSLAAALAVLAPVLRAIAGFFARRQPDASLGLLGAAARIPFLPSAVVLLIGALLPLVVLSFASHVTYELGFSWWQGVAITLVAAAMTLLLGSRECVKFVNRSAPLTIYNARLARAFLGALNPARRYHRDGRNVTHVVAGDDLPYDEYAPHEAGGPLHVINCAVNETVDAASMRGLRDRQAENLAVGPAGINIARCWHARWTTDETGSPALVPLAAGTAPHPFLSKTGGAVPVERLNLREWIGISGAAVSPGMGRRTGTALSLLFTLSNLRLGYWWNSGLEVQQRRRVPVRGGFVDSVKSKLFRWFRAQTLLLRELTGRFGGPWMRYWYLSDGGNFENTGAYELLRRRVPYVILCDAGRDHQHQGSDIATLARLARIDFGAEITEVDNDPATFLTTLHSFGVPEQITRHLGGLGDLLPSDNSLPKKHAALYRVRYPEPTGRDAWHGRRHTWLLYIKATVTGDETADLRHYRATHPDFPNESTLDQFFDEPQWESYRKLGDHIGSKLFV